MLDNKKPIYADSVDRFLHEFFGDPYNFMDMPANWQSSVANIRKLPEFFPNSRDSMKSYPTFKEYYAENISPQARQFIKDAATIYKSHPTFATKLIGAAINAYNEESVLYNELYNIFCNSLTAAKPSLEEMLKLGRQFISCSSLMPRQGSMPSFEVTLLDLYISLARTDPAQVVRTFIEDSLTVLKPYTSDRSWEFDIPNVFLLRNFDREYELANLIKETCPRITKGILIAILRAKNHTRSKGELTVEEVLDYEKVAHDLYDLEIKSEAQSTDDKGLVYGTILTFGNVENDYWQDILRKTWSLTELKDDFSNLPPYNKFDLLRMVSLYAEPNSEMATRALEKYTNIIYDPSFVGKNVYNNIRKMFNAISFAAANNNNPYYHRNSKFKPDLAHPVYIETEKAYWVLADYFIKNRSNNIFNLLYQGIYCDFEPFSNKVSDYYIENFYEIAKHEPMEAGGALSSIANMYMCNYDEGSKFKEANFLKVFQQTYLVLKKINKEAAVIAANGMRKSHGPQKDRDWRTPEIIAEENSLENKTINFLKKNGFISNQKK